MTQYAAFSRKIRRPLSCGVSQRPVANLSPDANRGIPQVVASVAAVATSNSDRVDIKLLIQQLRNDGVVLHHHENTLHIRPRHWHQLEQINGHWKAMLFFLQTNEMDD